MWSQRLASSDRLRQPLGRRPGRACWSGSASSAKIERTLVEGEIFGFYLHPAVWGQGAATQLMAASLRGLANLGLDPVVAWTHPGGVRGRFPSTSRAASERRDDPGSKPSWFRDRCTGTRVCARWQLLTELARAPIAVLGYLERQVLR